MALHLHNQSRLASGILSGTSTPQKQDFVVGSFNVTSLIEASISPSMLLQNFVEFPPDWTSATSPCSYPLLYSKEKSFHCANPLILSSPFIIDRRLRLSRAAPSYTLENNTAGLRLEASDRYDQPQLMFPRQTSWKLLKNDPWQKWKVIKEY